MDINGRENHRNIRRDGILRYSSCFKGIFDRINAEKDWDYPRIIIDNNTKLPSKVRAILYNEKKETIIEGMCDSIKKLNVCGADIIFIPCNTAHYFMEDIKKELPDVNILDMIASVMEKCEERKLVKVGILASEGTIVSDIYGKYVKNSDLKISYPPESEFMTIRRFMEDVKHNDITRRTKIGLVNELNNFDNPDCVILACTELSVIWNSLSKTQKGKCKYSVIDSLDIGINKMISLLQ